jgi:hypothetical protein
LTALSTAVLTAALEPLVVFAWSASAASTTMIRMIIIMYKMA